MKFYPLLLLHGFLFGFVSAQDTLKISAPISKQKVEKYQKIRKDLSTKKEDTNGDTYTKIANDYEQKLDYDNASIYYNKAKDAYKDNANNAKTKHAEKKAEELKSVESVAIMPAANAPTEVKKSQENKDSRLNSNSTNTNLFNQNDKVGYYNVISQNATLYADTINSKNLQLKLSGSADLGSDISNFNNKVSQEKLPASEILKLEVQLENNFIQNNNISGLITLKKQIIKNNEVKKHPEILTKKMKEAGELMIQAGQELEGEDMLLKAYSIAKANNQTMELKNILAKLVQYYDRTNNKNKSLIYLKDFLNNLQNIIVQDSSLVDYTLLVRTEERIQELEHEKQLQTQLIKRTNMFNYVLIFALISFMILSYVIFKALAQNKKNKQKVELQSLRREMNPHFIFNSLNSINQFIVNNNELEANKYLTSFSKLMRQFMDNSKEDFIRFDKELELLEMYLKLEQQRFSDKFNYEIYIDEILKEQPFEIPNMLIQPFIENAVWHGLRYIDTKGYIKLSFTKFNDKIKVEIEDNGIGIEKSKALKTKNQKINSSRGLKNIDERISLLNSIYYIKLEKTIMSKPNNQGVLVQLIFPIKST